MRLSHKVTAPRDARCPQCGYELLGGLRAGVHRCAECGFQFDRRLLLSRKYDWDLWRKSVGRYFLALLILCVLLVVTFVVISIVGEPW